MTIALADAVLCVDCELISSRTPEMVCIGCASTAVLQLSTVLGTIPPYEGAFLENAQERVILKGGRHGR